MISVMKRNLIYICSFAVIALAMILLPDDAIAELSSSDVESISGCEVYDKWADYAPPEVVAWCWGPVGTCEIHYHSDRISVDQQCDGLKIK